jgi:hypothetical protein
MAVVFAKGGPVIGSRSRFMKTPDTFRTNIQRTGYKKKTPDGEMSNPVGDTKSQKPVKPQK